MVRRQLKWLLRRLGRQKGYTMLNVSGLAVALAVAALLLLFIRHETSYERFHAHAERIHLLRVEGVLMGQPLSSLSLPPAIGPALAEGLPGVEQAVRVRPAPRLRVRRGTELHEVEGIDFIDSNVFDVFSFEVMAGDALTALVEPGAIVLTESLARDLFGTASAEQHLGRLIGFEGSTARVTGVMADVPPTTHWRPRALLSLAALTRNGGGLDDSSYRTYLLLRPDADLDQTLEKVPAALEPLVAGTLYSEYSYHATPIRDIHLRGYGTAGPRGGVERGITEPSVARLRIFAVVALLIVLLAGVNYVNLATALGLARAREVGVRKVMGAGRLQLAAQFVGEAIAVAAVAGVLALGLVAAGIGYFADALRIELALSLREWLGLAGDFLGLSLSVGLLAGAYPAAALSRAQPSDAFRARAPSGLGGRRIRHALVVGQFAASIALVVVTLVMSRQVAFMQDDHGGIAPENILAVQTGHGFGQGRFDQLQAELEAHPAVHEAAAMLWNPFSRARAFMPIHFADGRPPVTANWFVVDPEIRPLLRMELVAGEDLPQRWTRGEASPLIMNETAAASLGWTAEEAIGQTLTFGYQPEPGRVVGVVRDFHYASLREPIEPQLFAVAAPMQRQTLLLRYNPAHTADLMATVGQAWQRVAPDEPLRTEFLDEFQALLYDAERRLTSLFGAFGAVAVLIAVLGLFGLGAYSAQKRRGEVAVRKVFGASEASVVALLTRDFARLVVMAFLLAAPLSYFLMRRWLDGFAYHVELGPDVFLLAGGGALVVALLTVAYHALRAASADPVSTLRAE